MARCSSSWVIGRPKPRSEPSTARRDRSLSPRVMRHRRVLQYANIISQIAICCQGQNLACYQRLTALCEETMAAGFVWLERMEVMIQNKIRRGLAAVLPAFTRTQTRVSVLLDLAD